MSGSGKLATGADRVAELSDEVRGFLRDLLLSLADNKRLLGIRYSDRLLGSPSLETGIAAASMAQDEWGHSRLTYALLADFGEDPKQLEHEREADRYYSMEALDVPLGSYAAMIAAALLIDGALSVQYESLAESRYAPVRNRVQKLLDEESLHERFAAGWTQRLAQSRIREEFVAELGRLLPLTLQWFGPPESAACEALLEDGVIADGPDAARNRFLRKIAPVLDRVGMANGLGLSRAGSEWRYQHGLDWTVWDDARRRRTPGGPDRDALARMRGDRNRSMLLE